MPLSKVKNRDRMRQIRLHKRHLSPCQSKPVQPKPSIDEEFTTSKDWLIIATPFPEVDADGNPVYEGG